MSRRSYDSYATESSISDNEWPKKHSYGETLYRDLHGLKSQKRGGARQEYDTPIRREYAAPGYNRNRDTRHNYDSSNQDYNDSYHRSSPRSDSRPYITPHIGAQGVKNVKEYGYNTRGIDNHADNYSYDSPGNVSTRKIVRDPKDHRRILKNGKKFTLGKCCRKMFLFLLVAVIIALCSGGTWYLITHYLTNKEGKTPVEPRGRYISNVIFPYEFKVKYTSMSTDDQSFVNFERQYCDEIKGVLNTSLYSCEISKFQSIINKQPRSQVSALTSLEFYMQSLNTEITKKGLLTQQEIILMLIKNKFLNGNLRTTYFKTEPLSKPITIFLDIKITKDDVDQLCDAMNEVFKDSIKKCRLDEDLFPSKVVLNVKISTAFVKRSLRLSHLQYQRNNEAKVLTSTLRSADQRFLGRHGFRRNSSTTFVEVAPTEAPSTTAAPTSTITTAALSSSPTTTAEQTTPEVTTQATSSVATSLPTTISDLTSSQPETSVETSKSTTPGRITKTPGPRTSSTTPGFFSTTPGFKTNDGTLYPVDTKTPGPRDMPK